jgi:hypothetical protein
MTRLTRVVEERESSFGIGGRKDSEAWAIACEMVWDATGEATWEEACELTWENAETASEELSVTPSAIKEQPKRIVRKKLCSRVTYMPKLWTMFIVLNILRGKWWWKNNFQLIGYSVWWANIKRMCGASLAVWCLHDGVYRWEDWRKKRNCDARSCIQRQLLRKTW